MKGLQPTDGIGLNSRRCAYEAGRLALALGLCLGGWAVACHSPSSRPPAESPVISRDARESLRTHPPVMRSMALQSLASGALRIFVEYTPDPRLEKRLTLQLAQGPVTFTRGADGRYVGEIRLTAEQREVLAKRDEEIRRLGPKAIHYHFKEREQIGPPVVVPPMGLSGTVLQEEAPDEEASDGSVVEVPLSYLEIAALAGDPESVLIIKDRCEADEKNEGKCVDHMVVDDPTRTWDPCAPNVGNGAGTWTFGHLMKQLAGANASKVTEDWLNTWSADQVVNGHTVPRRPKIDDVIRNWPLAGGALDLDRAPLRLLAIVNRADLADNFQFDAGPGNVGELRFVFDVAPQRLSENRTVCGVKRFQVIVEYQVMASSCTEVAAWAQRWIDLKDLQRGSDSYNSALESLTEDVVTNGKGHFAQIRTNEIALAETVGGNTPWEMREFEYTGQKLEQRTVRRTPLDDLNGSAALSQWVNQYAADIKDLVHEFTGVDAGVNPQMLDPDHFWDGDSATPIADAEARRLFSENTCSGCHARETCTEFHHVIPYGPGREAGLSHFLTGDQVVPDPVACPSECPEAPAACSPGAPDACCRQPSDLVRRQVALDGVRQCILPSVYVPLHAVH